jgi:hypothetical protein
LGHGNEENVKVKYIDAVLESTNELRDEEAAQQPPPPWHEGGLRRRSGYLGNDHESIENNSDKFRPKIDT